MDELFKFVGSIVGPAIAAIIALSWWRVQLIGKRRFEIAEEALLAFAHAKDALEQIRSPAGYSHEGSSRTPIEGESAEVAEQRKRYYATIERANNQADAFIGLRKTQLLCSYHFGQDTAEAFKSLIVGRNRAVISAGALIRSVRPRHLPMTDQELEFNQKCENAIWSGLPEDDDIAQQVDAAQLSLEAACTRHLQPRYAILPFRWNRAGRLQAVAAGAARWLKQE